MGFIPMSYRFRVRPKHSVWGWVLNSFHTPPNTIVYCITGADNSTSHLEEWKFVNQSKYQLGILLPCGGIGEGTSGYLGLGPQSQSGCLGLTSTLATLPKLRDDCWPPGSPGCILIFLRQIIIHSTKRLMAAHIHRVTQLTEIFHISCLSSMRITRVTSGGRPCEYL